MSSILSITQLLRAGVLGALFLVLNSIVQSAAAQTRPGSPPDTMEERVRACAGCHGQAGRGVNNVYFPRLAGKPAGYLYNQLVAFREGRRKYAPMNFMLAYLPDEYLIKMADYYAKVELPYDRPLPPVASSAVLEQGRALVLNGNPTRELPACVSCHGANLSGREPGIPALIGMRSDYLSAQLGAWRYGTRTALEPDCMQLVAARLTEADVAAVAAYLSSMPIPANTRPAKAGNERLPLECGSQKH